MSTDGFYSQTHLYAASEFRQLNSTLVGNMSTGVTTGVFWRSGGSYGGVEPQATPNRTVIVRAGHGVYRKDATEAVLARWDTVASVAIAASDPTNGRIDRICVRLFGDSDTTDSSGASIMTAYTPGNPYTGTVSRQNKTGEIVVITGAPSSTPVVPALPSNQYIELARVNMPAGATTITSNGVGGSGTITDVRTLLAPLAPVVVPNLAAMAGAPVGTYFFSTADDRAGVVRSTGAVLDSTSGRTLGESLRTTTSSDNTGFDNLIGVSVTITLPQTTNVKAEFGGPLNGSASARYTCRYAAGVTAGIADTRLSILQMYCGGVTSSSSTATKTLTLGAGTYTFVLTLGGAASGTTASVQASTENPVFLRIVEA